MKTMILVILLVFALINAKGQAAPISGRNSSPDNSTPTPSANSSTNIINNSPDIPVLFVKARVNFYSVYQEIEALERYTEETYNLSYQNCYVRLNNTNDVDVNTLKDDLKYAKQLVPVIKELADNETDEVIINYYEEMLNSTGKGIVALTNLIVALEKNVTGVNVTDSEETKGSNAAATNQTKDKPSPSPTKTEVESKDDSEKDRCEKLDKAVKMSAIKLQITLTYEDITKMQSNQKM